MKAVAMMIVLASVALPASAGGQARTAVQVGDSAAAVAVAARFHDALARGDSAGALAQLGDSVVVLESGEMETRADYRAHHLAADIEFARAVPAVRTVRHVSVVGDAAWVIATTESRGTFRGRAVNAVGAELLVLARGADGWRIVAIHWSSHRVTTGP
ncbi:MAG: nuclear transport factor 2 family protein [Gemmatimonadaceae bacterium]|nr:nuclear transport factor 2 family protein [Gemmatimonadaceae bacterium]NUQ94109.1 nuclear transport factor 2 family protein [Gemmatimonadaceae bacterium]NUR18017.1 nuclear transport factor 2 family protein [Gemmatimonadaceae bacterium]NUS96018.1 nuclear transport factor 2 family protein [Gemmatimonadaceae bacterium]